MKTINPFGDAPDTPAKRGAVKFFSDFASQVPGAQEADIEITNRGNGEFQISMTVWDGVDIKDPVSMLELQRTFYNDGTVRLDIFEIIDTLQGQGLAKKLNKLQLKFMDKFKYTRYLLQANLEVGGYAWLKYGMSPTKPKDLINLVQRYFYKQVEDSPEWLFWRKQSQAMFDAPDSLKYVRENLDILKPAFIGSSWNGGLDLNDKKGRELLEKYIGSKPRVPKKNVSDYMVDIQSRHQVYLERFKAKLIQDYRGKIVKVDKKLNAIFAKLDVDRLNQLPVSERRKLYREIKLLQIQEYKTFEEELDKELQALSVEEEDFEVDGIQAATTGFPVNKASKSYAAALKNPIQATGDLLKPFISDLSRRNMKRVEREMQISLSQGRTISQTVRAIRGTKKGNYRDGVLNKNWNDARTVIRTATQHVSSQARQVVWEQNKDIINGYQWVSTLDGDTSPKCRTLDTEVFEVGKGPLPPIHPNCRSTTVPYFKDDIDLWDEDATRSAETGPVQVSTSYYQWLGQQPAAFQNDALGINRAKLLRNGGLSTKEFAELQLNKNFKPLTLDEMRQLKPNAFKKADI